MLVVGLLCTRVLMKNMKLKSINNHEDEVTGQNPALMYAIGSSLMKDGISPQTSHSGTFTSIS